MCASDDVDAFARAHARSYARCTDCDLVFMLREYHPDSAAQRAIYDLHRNEGDDMRYRAYLDRLAAPLMERLTPGMRGLDYGCGPGPVLAAMLVERGFDMSVYDPLYADEPGVLQRRYDFVTCSEVAEHFHGPAREFERLASLLDARGWLAVMTQLLSADRDFAGWHYPRDPTHVSFYTARTLEWLAQRHGWALHRPSANVALFQRA
ncbi:MAG: class I SAM-dependent methyltransferase [Dokdonella sp.]